MKKVFIILCFLLFLLLNTQFIKSQEDENNTDTEKDEADNTNNEETEETEETEEKETEEKKEDEEFTNKKVDIKVDSTRVFIFSKGVKVGRAMIDIKAMNEAITKLLPVGTDLEEYDVAQMGIVLKELEVIHEDINIIASRQSELVHIIPYRHLSLKLDCEEDNFFGTYCTVNFQKGGSDGDYKSDLALTFGHCAKQMTLENVDKLELIIETLMSHHKQVLADKTKSAEKAAEQYNYYTDLYDDSLKKRDMTKEIPSLQGKLDAKNIECHDFKKEHDATLKDFQNLIEIISKDTEQIQILKNEVMALSQQKEQFEREQVDMRRKKLTANSYATNVESTKGQIRNYMQAMLSYNPHLLQGIGSVENCFTNNGINPNCKNRINSA